MMKVFFLTGALLIGICAEGAKATSKATYWICDSTSQNRVIQHEGHAMRACTALCKKKGRGVQVVNPPHFWWVSAASLVRMNKHEFKKICPTINKGLGCLCIKK